MIKSTQFSFIIFTDHDATVKINNQINFSTSFTDKLNLRLIKTSKYIQQFNFIIKHKLEKQHIVSNALFRFEIINENLTTSKNDELNALWIYQKIFYANTTTEINDEFKQRIIDEYIKNKS